MIGKLDPTVYFDGNAVPNDETIQFLSDIFVNNIAMDWPDYEAGARLSLFPHEKVELNLGIAETDSDLDDVFDDNFIVIELNFKSKAGEREGNYRLYSWWNNSDHEKLDNPKEDSERGKGFGLSFDQQISKYLTAFARFGLQDDDIYEVKRSWIIGGQVAGDLWGRPEDVFGFAYGQAELSDDFEDLLRDEQCSPGDEGRLEAYYRYEINDHVTITPDLQVVHDLGGVSSADTVTIFGVRTQLDF